MSANLNIKCNERVMHLNIKYDEKSTHLNIMCNERLTHLNIKCKEGFTRGGHCKMLRSLSYTRHSRTVGTVPCMSHYRSPGARNA